VATLKQRTDTKIFGDGVGRIQFFKKDVIVIGLKTNRSEFLHIGSPQIIHLFDGVSRLINKNDPLRATNDNEVDGIRTIQKLD